MTFTCHGFLLEQKTIDTELVIVNSKDNVHLFLSEGALQIAVKKSDSKSEGEKERYTHLNAELQRIPRRDKKAFLSDQCKEIEENNRMEKARDLFKKIKDTKGTFHAKMGLIKERNSIDLTKAEDLKRGGKNTQKNCTKKILMTKIIMMV